jgi:serine O-acetyltransferase
MANELVKKLYIKHKSNAPLPPTNDGCEWVKYLLGLLFPELLNKKESSESNIAARLSELQQSLFEILDKMSVHYPQLNPSYVSEQFFIELDNIYILLQKDIEAILGGDPAAQSETEVILAYPGFLAIAHYRIAHVLHKLKTPVIPRIITSNAHMRTGIDIHPGATIGPYFCIDHGTGIVIGETTHIGSRVKLYQGVTLGALSVDKSMASQKRHPTIEDSVIIYAGATILGGETIIGKNSVIGGNVWLTKSVAPFSIVYHKPQIEVRQADLKSEIPS